MEPYLPARSCIISTSYATLSSFALRFPPALFSSCFASFFPPRRRRTAFESLLSDTSDEEGTITDEHEEISRPNRGRIATDPDFKQPGAGVLDDDVDEARLLYFSCKLEPATYRISVSFHRLFCR